MKVSRCSPRTGQINAMDLPVTQEQLDELWFNPGRRMIQHIFPNLTPSQREFLLTGYTQEDWDAIFPPEEDE